MESKTTGKQMKENKLNKFKIWLFNIKQDELYHMPMYLAFSIIVVAFLSAGLSSQEEIVADSVFNGYVWGLSIIGLIGSYYFLLNHLKGFFLLGSISFYPSIFLPSLIGYTAIVVIGMMIYCIYMYRCWHADRD